MTSILSLALVLQLHNVAGAPPAVVDEAAIELTRVYRALGVDAEWDHTGAADRGVVRVVVLANETGALRRTADTVMGAATRTPNGSGVVYVFYERVRAEAERYGVSTALVLACAMEHELGHLLLPGGGHSRDGLMRGCWNRADFQRADQGQLRFSRDQIALMRRASGLAGAVRSSAVSTPGSEPLVEHERGDRARQ